MRAVQNTADQLKIFTGKGQTYEEYCSLLISAATSYDDHHKPKSFLSRHNTNNRRVYQHELDSNDGSSWEDQGDFDQFDVHTDVHEIEAYATNFQGSRNNSNNASTFLPQSIYKEMDDQSRSAWSQMSPNIKSKIVKSLSPDNQTSATRTSSFPKKGVGGRNVNLHEISLYDLLANFHVSNDQNQVSTDDTITTTDVETATNTTNNETTSHDNDQLLIQAMKSSGSNAAKPQHSPADVINLLSEKSTKV